MLSYLTLRNGTTVLFALLFAQATQAQEIAISYFRAQLPLTLRLTSGIQAHYRYSWFPRWSAAVALGYSGATVSETFDFLSAKGRLTFAERYALLDAYVTRHFSRSPAVLLGLSMGLSVAYVNADEANIKIFQSGEEKKNFEKYHTVARFLFLSPEVQFSSVGRLGVVLRPAFRFPLGDESRPLKQKITYESVGFGQTTTLTYYLGPIIGVHVGLFYRLL